MISREVADLLRAIADLLERGSPEQTRVAAELLSGLSKPARRDNLSRSSMKELNDLSEVADRIVRAESRQEGLDIISGLQLTRKELMEIAKDKNIHILKNDNVATIEDKIIEALVGSRLNSKAVRGER